MPKHQSDACTAVAIVVFLLASPRNAQAQTVTTIYTFVGGSNSSVNPYGAIAQGRDGEYYGMTVPGVIYKVSASGTFNILYTLSGTDGQMCNGLVLGSDGNFYGTCFLGGGQGKLYRDFFSGDAHRNLQGVAFLRWLARQWDGWV